uniref:Uncharacterized protein n=1 Tax=Rhizophora mucronata TaxID=61149 RepID=A0A2P2NBG8_RHIMU
MNTNLCLEIIFFFHYSADVKEEVNKNKFK